MKRITSGLSPCGESAKHYPQFSGTMARLSPGRKDAATLRDAMPIRRNSGEKAASAPFP
jgi:hypothetical protein